MTQTIQLRRGIASLWTTVNPVLASGEVGFEEDTNKFKIGDGTTAWNSLAYATESLLEDFGNITGTTNRITVTGGTGAVYGDGVALNLPQDIHTGATPQFAGLFVKVDGEKLYLGAGNDLVIGYDGSDGTIDTSKVAPSDLNITCGANKTVELQNIVYDDLRINPGSFDRFGLSDPAPVLYYPAEGGLGVSLYEFAKDDWVSFTCQLPHGYKQGTDIYCHLHWTPGPNGVAEDGNTVGWKVDYSWANVNGTFGAVNTLDLSDACNGENDAHQKTISATIDGHLANISSMLICNLRRSDTGTDDTWSGTLAGSLPMILEVDFHFQINTMGSRFEGVK